MVSGVLLVSAKVLNSKSGHLWPFERNTGLGNEADSNHFRPFKPIPCNPFIADFYCLGSRPCFENICLHSNYPEIQVQSVQLELSFYRVHMLILIINSIN